jgi:hypothetical protein
MNAIKRPIKTNGYSFAKQGARREQRRVEAEARQAVYARLCLGVKIHTCNARRGQSLREYNRLVAKLSPAPNTCLKGA